MRPGLILAGALAALLQPARVAACSVCAAGDPLVAASDSASDAGEIRLALETEWLTASAASDHHPGAQEDLEQGTLRLLGVYSPVDALNLVVQVPLVRKELTVTGGMADPSAQEGLGDVEVAARWFFWDRTDFSRMRHQSAALSAGTSLPTGEDEAAQDGVPLDPHAQLGTGGFGPYAGILYRLEQSAWHAFASFTGRLRTESEAGYRYGSSLHWSLHGQRQLGGGVAVGLGVDGRWAARDEHDGVAQENTGGLVLAVVPALHASLFGDAWLSVRAQVPFATGLYGEQTVGPTFVAGLQYTIR